MDSCFVIDPCRGPGLLSVSPCMMHPSFISFLPLSTEYPSKGRAGGTQVPPHGAEISGGSVACAWESRKPNEVWAFEALLIMSNEFMTRVSGAR